MHTVSWGIGRPKIRPSGVGTMPKKTGIVMITSKRCLVKGMALLAGLLLSGLAPAFAQTRAEDPGDKKAAEQKLFNFEMRGKPWSSVFEWLADNTGRKFVGPNVNLPGTFNVISPKGQKYTLPQIIDIINDGLQTQKWVMLNRGTSFVIVPADEKIDPALLPRIDIKDLAEHGDTEIVSAVYQCKSLNAEDTRPTDSE